MSTYQTPYTTLNINTPIFVNVGFFDELQQTVTITPDGVIEGVVQGTTFIQNGVGGRVYRDWFSFKSVYEMLYFWAHNKQWFKNHNLSIDINLDDHDCCADGFISIRKNNKHQKGFFVPFNSAIHSNLEKIYN